MPFLMLAAVMAAWRVGLWGAGLPLFGNLLFFYHPLINQASRQLVEGSAPLWNPYAFCGIPLLADPQSGVLCPAHILFRFFPFARAFRLELAADLCLMAFFTYCLGRRLGLRKSSAALAGFLAASNGFVYYHAGLTAQLDSLALMPAVLLFWSSGAGVWAGLALALQYLSGHPFFLYITLAACLFFPPRRPLRTFALAAASALALSAVQLLPALELFAGAVRSGALEKASLLAYSLSPDELWAMLSRPWWNRFAENFSGDPTITSFYVGLPALAAALWGVNASKAGRAAGLCALAACWLMLGDHTPVYPALLKLAPGLSLFRFPAQWGALCALGLALLAGFGAARLGRTARAALCAVILADLWVFMALPPTARAAPEFYPLKPKALASGKLEPGSRIAHTFAFMASQAESQKTDILPSQMEDYWISLKDALVPSHAGAFGLREVLSDNLYRPRLAEPLLRRTLAADKRGLPFLRFLGVSVLIDEGPKGRARVYSITAPRSRLTWVSRARYLNTPEGLSYLTSEEFDPESEVVLEAPGLETTASGNGKPQVLEETPTRLSALTDADAPGFLVWADTFYPGWEAAVDGKPAHILRANGAYRALAVPAGVHDVRFRYRPRLFQLGLLITFLSLTALAAAAARRHAIFPG